MLSSQEEQNLYDLQYFLRIFKKYFPFILTVSSSVFGLIVLATFTQTSVYEAQGKLLLKQSEGYSLASPDQKVGGLTGLSQTSNPVDTEAQIVLSNSIVQQTIDKLQLKDQRGQPLEVKAFLTKFKVNSIRGTDVLELTYQSHKPIEAAEIINTLMKIYLENNILINRAETTSTKEFLSRQLPQIENRVAQAEVALRRFKDENQVVSLEEEAQEGVRELKNLSNEIVKAQAQMADANTRYAGLQYQLQLTSQQAVKLTNISQSPGIQQVLTEYQKAQDELAVLQTRFTEQHPTVKNLISKEQALRQQLQKRVTQAVNNQEPIPEKNLQIGNLQQTLTAELVKSELDRLAWAKQVQVLQKAFLSSQTRLSNLPKLQQRQQALERRLQVAQITYQQALKQLQEVEVIEKQKIGNVRIISEALIPEQPIYPKVALNLALGGFLGVLLGTGTALFLEAMNKSLKTVEEVRRLWGYPLLGSIPHLNHQEKILAELPIRDSPYSSTSASFEILMTNLGFASAEKELRVILVTSSIPEEGKSFVAANLAVAMAQMGYRVLLLDANMRHPRQHEIWQLPNITGLSNLLLGQHESPKAAQVLVGLDVLTSGTFPPNPVALIRSQNMATLIHTSAKEYDFVIIDTPALNTSAEAQILGKLADGMMLVVHPTLVDSDTVIATKSLIENSGQRVLGMVVNGIVNDNDYSYYHPQKDNNPQSLVRKKLANYSNK